MNDDEKTEGVLLIIPKKEVGGGCLAKFKRMKRLGKKSIVIISHDIIYLNKTKK